MKVHTCDYCGHAVYFQNSRCVSCNTQLAFDPASLSILSLSAPLCRNGQIYKACNWLATESSHSGFCIACELNRTIPSLSSEKNLRLWQKLQLEKNRLVYSLLRFGLPVLSRQASPGTGLAFDFLDSGTKSDSQVITGHAKGIITLDISEADDAHREAVRQSLGEPYRTLLGHFRHESAHYYWDRLIRHTVLLERFRARFGDERTDYSLALQRHYENGAPADWNHQYISSYASAHPWEDWAESWAHYFHIVDTLESASELGLVLDPATGRTPSIQAVSSFDPYRHPDPYQLIERWKPVSVALNMLNRSLGQGDAYPFVLMPVVIEKLALVHDVIAAGHHVTPLNLSDNYGS